MSVLNMVTLDFRLDERGGWSQGDRPVNTVLIFVELCEILRKVWFGVFWFDVRIESAH